MHIRFIGHITSETPILITRPLPKGKKPALLTMNIIRTNSNSAVPVPVIPGETIKGALRGLAQLRAITAARKINPAIQSSVEKIHEQGCGGVAFAADDRTLGGENVLRARQPILSLFGSANPKLTGRLIVEPALALGAIHAAPGSAAWDNPAEAGLLPGTRRDPLEVNPEMADLLPESEKKLWLLQKELNSAAGPARRHLKDCQNALRLAERQAAKDGRGDDLTVFRKAVEDAEKSLAAFEDKDEYKNAVTRPLDHRPAAAPGLLFVHRIELRNASPEETGLFLAIFREWNLNPRIGGGRTPGYGRITGYWDITLLEDDKWVPAGTLCLGDDSQQTTLTHADLTAAVTAWKNAEADLLNRFDIFPASAA